MHWVSRIVSGVLVVALFVLSVTQTIALFQTVLPPDKSLEAFLGPSVTDGAFLAWSLTLVFDSKDELSKAISFIMALISFVGIFACVIGQAFLNASRLHLTVVDPNVSLAVVIGIWALVPVNVLAWMVTHLMNVTEIAHLLTWNSRIRVVESSSTTTQTPPTALPPASEGTTTTETEQLEVVSSSRKKK